MYGLYNSFGWYGGCAAGAVAGVRVSELEVQPPPIISLTTISHHALPTVHNPPPSALHRPSKLHLESTSTLLYACSAMNAAALGVTLVCWRRMFALVEAVDKDHQEASGSGSMSVGLKSADRTRGVAAVLCSTYSKATAIVLIGGVAVTVAGNELWTQTYGSSRTKFDGATDGALGIGVTSGLSPHSGWLYYLPSAVGLMVVVVLFAKVTTASTVWQWSTRQVGMPSAVMSVSTQAVRRSPRGAPVSPVLL